MNDGGERETSPRPVRVAGPADASRAKRATAVIYPPGKPFGVHGVAASLGRRRRPTPQLLPSRSTTAALTGNPRRRSRLDRRLARDLRHRRRRLATHLQGWDNASRARPQGGATTFNSASAFV